MSGTTHMIQMGRDSKGRFSISHYSCRDIGRPVGRERRGQMKVRTFKKGEYSKFAAYVATLVEAGYLSPSVGSRYRAKGICILGAES